MVGMSVAERLKNLREKMHKACIESGQDPLSVRLIAVSKLHPPQAVREAFAAGQTEFGENYVQEFSEKESVLSDVDLHWHFIGRIQTNKLSKIAGRFEVIHSVDRVEVVRKL